MDDGQLRAVAHQLGQSEQPVVPAFFHVFQQLGLVPGVELGQVDVVHAHFQGAHGLEHALFQGLADGHDLAGGHHLGAQVVLRAYEFVEGEAGHLGDDIVEAGLQGGGTAAYGDLVQREAHGDLGGDAGDGVTAGLGGQSRGTGDPGVDLDQVVFVGMGI